MPLHEPSPQAGVPRVDVLGVGVSAINMDQTLDLMDHWITDGQPNYVCVTGVHGVMESQRDERSGRSTTTRGWSRPTACRWCGGPAGRAGDM